MKKYHELVERTCTLQIRGHSWKLEVLRAKDYDKKFRNERNTKAICEKSTRTIDFRNEISLKVVIHELWHAYCSYFYLGSTADVHKEDFEEMGAEMLEDTLYEYADKAQYAYGCIVGAAQAEKERKELEWSQPKSQE